MKNFEVGILIYARHIYGVKILYRNRSLYLKTKNDLYQVDLHLANENIYRFYSMTRPAVFTDTCFARGVFYMAAYDTYKQINKIPTKEDWEKFINDASAFVVSRECI